MQNFLKKEQSYRDFFKETKAKEYIKKYMKEIQLHFDISDKKMRIILYRIYNENSFTNLSKIFIKNKISMLKSFYKEKIRGKTWK